MEQTQINVDVSKLISPVFYQDLVDAINYEFSYLWEYGGRGSFKSSFVGILIPILMMSDPEANAICIRNIGATTRTSIYNQISWRNRPIRSRTSMASLKG